MRAFAIPPSRRSSSSTTISSCWSCFTGRRWRSRTSRCSCSARLMDHALKARGQRATIVGATSGDTGAAAIEAFRGLSQVDVFILLSARPRLRRAAPPDDDGRRAQYPRHRPRRHVRRRAGRREGAVPQHRRLREKLNLCGVNSINWARIVAQIVYYFTSAAALGAPFRPVSFVVPTGNFGDIFAGYIAKHMGLPIERLVIATNANDILAARAGERDATQSARSQATQSPSMDIQVSSNFERLLFEAYGRDARGDPRPDGGARSNRGAFAIDPPRRWPRSAPNSTPAAPARRRRAKRSRGCGAQARYLARSAYGGRRRRRAARSRAARDAYAAASCLAPPIRRNSPTRSRPRLASAPHCPRISPTSTNGRSISRCCPTIRARSNASSARAALRQKAAS